MTTNSTPWWSKDTVAVVTGANRGIGYEIVRQLAEKGLTVVLTARDQSKGQAAIDALKAEGLESVWFHQLDVHSPESVQALARWLKSTFGGIDILVNNAGINAGPMGDDINYENAKAMVETNYYGVKNVTEGLLPVLRASPAGARIVNVSSRMGLYDRLKSQDLKKVFKDEDKYTTEIVDTLAIKYLEDVKMGRTDEEGWVPNNLALGPMYSESKMFLNSYAIVVSNSLKKSQPEDHQILVSTFCPGVTDTAMYAYSASLGFDVPEGFSTKSVADGADTGVWLALLPKEELLPKNGKLFGERQEYPFGWENPPF
ncbi:unnamed protein product [Calypogeia fissa]